LISSPLVVPRPSHSSAARIFTCPPFTSASRAPSAHTEAGRLASALALAQPLNISASRHLRLTNTRHNLLNTTAAPRVVIQLPTCQSPSATRRGTLSPPRECPLPHSPRFCSTAMTATHTAARMPANLYLLSTRTPQNTPANAAPISSRAQQPGVASIKEGM
jgi:hypothetical protein